MSSPALIGVAISIVANGLISIALTVQKVVHNQRRYDLIRRETEQTSGPNEDHEPHSQQTDHSDDPLPADHGYVKEPLWWCGLLLMILGELGNFTAYAYAPASTIAPLGTVSLVCNALIAPIYLRERLRWRDALGILCACAGAAIVVYGSKNEERHILPEELLLLLARPKVIAYLSSCLALALFLAHISARTVWGQRFILVDLVLMADFGGITVMCTKALSSFITALSVGLFQYGITYLLILVLTVTAILQVRYLNVSLQRFDTTQVMPVQFVTFTMAAITGSMILYDDLDSATPLSGSLFFGGCLLTFVGVYLITTKRRVIPELEADEEAAGATVAPAVIPSVAVLPSHTVSTIRDQPHTSLRTWMGAVQQQQQQQISSRRASVLASPNMRIPTHLPAVASPLSQQPVSASESGSSPTDSSAFVSALGTPGGPRPLRSSTSVDLIIQSAASVLVDAVRDVPQRLAHDLQIPSAPRSRQASMEIRALTRQERSVSSERLPLLEDPPAS